MLFDVEYGPDQSSISGLGTFGYLAYLCPVEVAWHA